MVRNEFFNLIEGLFQYFRYKESPKSATIDEWLIDLEFIESDALPFIKKAIKDEGNLPRNLPKTIKSFYAIYKRQNPTIKFIQYDSYEDLRFPLAKMHTAVELFIKKGRASFVQFCNNEHMPQQDRERCENKVKCLFERGAAEDLTKKVGIDFSGILKTDEKEQVKEAQHQRRKLFNTFPE
jgi:hypothetical protein